MEIVRARGRRERDPDIVGGPNIERNLKAASHDGRIIQLAFPAGSKVDINLMPVMLKRLTYTGSTLRTRTAAFKARVAQELESRVWPLIEEGRIKPVVRATFDLAQAARAHALMESSGHVGKIVLTVGNCDAPGHFFAAAASGCGDSMDASAPPPLSMVMAGRRRSSEMSPSTAIARA